MLNWLKSGALLACLVRLASSDVSISLPLTGQTYSASDGSASVKISWTESNATPLLSDIDSYTFVLCTGSNSAIHSLTTLKESVSASDIDDYTYTASIDASEGADGSYFIQVYAKASDGWTIHYTNRFTLEDMTGSYEPSDGDDTSPPDAQTSISDGTNTGVASIDSASFSVPYTEQTGKTRFAPMQSQPTGSVTKAKSAWARQFATSAVTYFSKYRASLYQITTITPGRSELVSSAVNWASHAPYPTSNGGWYPASERLTRSPTLYTPAILSQAGKTATTT